jgi:hypothetical protein
MRANERSDFIEKVRLLMYQKDHMTGYSDILQGFIPIHSGKYRVVT